MKINDVEASQLGLTFLDGTYSELLKLPKAKDTVATNWADEHGTERDMVNRVFESRTLNLPVLLTGDSIADFAAKRTAFNALMLAGRFNLKCPDINRQFNLAYLDCTNFKGDDDYCAFSLVCVDDFPHQNLTIV